MLQRKTGMCDFQGVKKGTEADLDTLSTRSKKNKHTNQTKKTQLPQSQVFSNCLSGYGYMDAVVVFAWRSSEQT